MRWELISCPVKDLSSRPQRKQRCRGEGFKVSAQILGITTHCVIPILCESAFNLHRTYARTLSHSYNFVSFVSFVVRFFILLRKSCFIFLLSLCSTLLPKGDATRTGSRYRVYAPFVVRSLIQCIFIQNWYKSYYL